MFLSKKRIDKIQFTFNLERCIVEEGGSMMVDYLNYTRSISSELISIKERVRYFIDGSHWGEDGRYKEIILMKLLQERLPKNVLLGTGFVMGRNNQLSSQIDIIIYEDNIPPLFQYDDFVIVNRHSVLGIIEVKSNIDSAVFKDAVKKGHKNGELIDRAVFNGIFGFESKYKFDDDSVPKAIRETLSESFGRINHISLGKNYFIKYFDEQSNKRYSTYKIKELSFGYFVSNLIHDILKNRNENEAIEEMENYLFSIENGKEAYRFTDQDIYN